MCVCLYYLAVNPDVQCKLQEEIDEVFESKDEGEEIDADDITNMKYLEQVSINILSYFLILKYFLYSKVLQEGQRLGPMPFSARMCTNDWQVPGDSFIIPKNTRVIIPIVSVEFYLI